MRKEITSLLTLSLLFILFSLPGRAQELFQPEIGVTGSLDNASLLRENGCTFIQPSVGSYLMPGESEKKFERNLKKHADLGIDVFACNSFIPGDLKSVGPEHDQAAVLEYAEKVFQRAQQADVEVIVFGSGASRRIPEGFSKEEAFAQFIALGKEMAPLAAKYDVIICMENLNSTETNMINTFEEAYQIASAIDHPNFKLTVDIYHMLMENESPEIILEAAKYVHHCDLAEKEGRAAPGVHNEDFRPYFNALKTIGYRGKIAIECRWDDMEAQLPLAVQTVKQQINETFGKQ